jgi:hypothetical protein
MKNHTSKSFQVVKYAETGRIIIKDLLDYLEAIKKEGEQAPSPQFVV